MGTPLGGAAAGTRSATVSYVTQVKFCSHSLAQKHKAENRKTAGQIGLLPLTESYCKSVIEPPGPGIPLARPHLVAAAEPMPRR